jgi:alkanesulfonate monooxygenase SsuD/methylene tetrahydromethanopterin reductase-like flavin-dependent oxidoreductase (luciferase family)
MMELGNAVVGSPATVLAALQAQLDLTQANYVLGQFIFGDMTMEESLRSIDLFAREVMPQLDAVAIGA